MKKLIVYIMMLLIVSMSTLAVVGAGFGITEQEQTMTQTQNMTNKEVAEQYLGDKCDADCLQRTEIERRRLVIEKFEGCSEAQCGNEIQVSKGKFTNDGIQVDAFQIRTRYEYKFLGFISMTADVTETASEEGVVYARNRNLWAWMHETFGGKE